MPDVPRLYKRGRVYWTWYYASGKRFDRSTGCRDRRAAEAVALRLERVAADPTLEAQASTELNQALSRLVQRRREEAKAGRGSSETADFYEKKAASLVRFFEHGGDPDARPTPRRALSAVGRATVRRSPSRRPGRRRGAGGVKGVGAANRGAAFGLPVLTSPKV